MSGRQSDPEYGYGFLPVLGELKSSVVTRRPKGVVIHLAPQRLSSSRQFRMTRRPAEHVMAQGFEVEAHDRLRAGVVELVVAVKRE